MIQDYVCDLLPVFNANFPSCSSSQHHKPNSLLFLLHRCNNFTFIFGSTGILQPTGLKIVVYLVKYTLKQLAKTPGA